MKRVSASTSSTHRVSFSTREVLWQNIKNVGGPLLSESIFSLLVLVYLVFSRRDYTGPKMTNLLDIIALVKPTALLGLSTIKVPS